MQHDKQLMVVEPSPNKQGHFAPLMLLLSLPLKPQAALACKRVPFDLYLPSALKKKMWSL
jgi:hypothetical protein